MLLSLSTQSASIATLGYLFSPAHEFSSFKTKKTKSSKNRENDLTKVFRDNELCRLGRQKLDTEGEM